MTTTAGAKCAEPSSWLGNGTSTGGSPRGVSQCPMRTYSARAVLPVENHDRAIGVLRANLRQQLARGEIADWDALLVVGPTEWVDLRGRTWFEYQAKVSARRWQRLS